MKYYFILVRMAKMKKKTDNIKFGGNWNVYTLLKV